MPKLADLMDAVEQTIEKLFYEARNIERSGSSARVMALRMELNDEACEIYRQAHHARDQFETDAQFCIFFEDLEMLMALFRAHQVDWTAQAIAANHGAYLQRCSQIAATARRWIGDMKACLIEPGMKPVMELRAGDRMRSI